MTDWREAEIERLVAAFAAEIDDALAFNTPSGAVVLDGEVWPEKIVRALLKALREPKEEMLQAPVRVPGEPRISPRSRYFIWRTMIDALLDEHP